MTLETFVDAMDTMVDGMFIGHRNVSRHPAIKSLWKYTCDIVYISPEREKECVVHYETQKKISIDDVDKTWEEVYKEFLPKIFDYISSEKFIKLKKDVQ